MEPSPFLICQNKEEESRKHIHEKGLQGFWFNVLTSLMHYFSLGRGQLKVMLFLTFYFWELSKGGAIRRIFSWQPCAVFETRLFGFRSEACEQAHL